MNLPIFEATIDETTGVTAIALVDRPAIERTFQAFSKEAQRFQATDTERRIVSGPLMIPNMPIYRRDDMGEYMVYFSKETIEQIGKKFMLEARTNAVNKMHDPSDVPSGTYLFESFFIDSTRGIKAPEGFGELPDGTWFGSYQVDDSTWNEFIKTGVFTGFSIEGVFIHTPVDPTEVEIRQYVESVFGTNGENQPFIDMSKFKEEMKKRFPSLFNEEKKVELTEAKLLDGTTVVYDGDLTEGTTLFVRTEEGDIPAPEGIHEVVQEGGNLLVSVDATGVVIGVEPVAEADGDEMAQFKADRLAFEQNVATQLENLAGLFEKLSKQLETSKADTAAALEMMAEAIIPEPEKKPAGMPEKKEKAQGMMKAIQKVKQSKQP